MASTKTRRKPKATSRPKPQKMEGVEIKKVNGIVEITTTKKPSELKLAGGTFREGQMVVVNGKDYQVYRAGYFTRDMAPGQLYLRPLAARSAKSRAQSTGLYIDAEGLLRNQPQYNRDTGKPLSTERIAKLAEAAGLTVTNKPEKPVKVAKPKLDSATAEVVATLPERLQDVVTEIMLDPSLNGVAKELMERVSDFDSPASALMTGVLVDPAGREHFDNHLDSRWAETKVDSLKVYPEVIIGGGLHAAIYASVRVAQGKPRPFVLESKSRAGGVFASSKNAAFYLNSRNRPGPLSVPGMGGALNVLPGSLVQPSNLSGSEYQTNDSLAVAIRTALAMNADVATNRKVTEVALQYAEDRDQQYPTIFFEDGSKIYTERLLVAAGIGKPNEIFSDDIDRSRVFTYEEFMAHMDSRFPFRGMTRVAVIGGGDGGKTVIEALTGQGPNQGLSVASLDYPQQIDWYGAPYVDCEAFSANVRSRYKGIARLMPSRDYPERPYRVNPKSTASAFGAGYECVYVNETPYDYVIEAAGYRQGATSFYNGTFAFDNFFVNGRAVATKDYNYSSQVYKIGPGSGIGANSMENTLLRGIPENLTSIFRYAPRTAALASFLD